MDDGDFSRGRIEEAIDTLKTEQAELRRELRLMHADLIEMKLQFVSARAGWKVILAVGGSASAVFGYLAEPLFRFIRTLKG